GPVPASGQVLAETLERHAGDPARVAARDGVFRPELESVLEEELGLETVPLELLAQRGARAPERGVGAPREHAPGVDPGPGSPARAARPGPPPPRAGGPGGGPRSRRRCPDPRPGPGRGGGGGSGPAGGGARAGGAAAPAPTAASSGTRGGAGPPASRPR